TTDPATWLHTPQNLARLAALTQAADARSRIVEDREAPAADPAGPVDRPRQEHEQRQQPGHGQGPGPRP
ncbi:MobF family relaxase, partial [Streptomyces sp. NPDC001732]